MTPLSPELYWTALTALMTSTLWAPHILQRIFEMKPYAAFRDPGHEDPTQAPFARRAIRAHTNAVENLGVFGLLAIIVELSNASTATTATAAMIYFFARVTHYLVYLFAVPWVRTPVFLVGFGCQLVLGLTILGLI